MPNKPPVDLREWLRKDQQTQDRQWVESQRQQDQQLAAMATAIRQYGVLIDALRDVMSISDTDWEAAVTRAIDRVALSRFVTVGE